MDLRACILLKKNKDIRVFIRMWDNCLRNGVKGMEERITRKKKY